MYLTGIEKLADLTEGTELYPHQLRAVGKFYRNNNSLVLAHGVGTGKTVTSIATFEAGKKAGKFKRALVVVPAALRQNYADSVKKFTKDKSVQVLTGKSEVNDDEHNVYFDSLDPDTAYTVVSYNMLVANPKQVFEAVKPDLLIYDEFHRARNTQAESYKIARAIRPYVKGFIGLTGSMLNNDPSDIVPLVNIASNNDAEIQTRGYFDHIFKEEVGSQQNIWGGTKKVNRLRNLEEARNLFGPYVDFLDTEDIPGTALPKKNVEVVRVEMSPEQKRLYEYAMDELPWYVRMKIKHSIPMNRQELNSVFSQLIATRQISNSLHTMTEGMSPEDSADKTPKIQTVLEDIKEHLSTTPDGQVVVFTNLVRGGADVMSAALRKADIPFGVFIGKGRELGPIKSSDEQRNASIQDYNAGKNKVIVISGAGVEGLSLPNTTMVATLDGHFNPEVILQAEARGRRIGGQAHRDPDERHVQVRRYMSVVPRSFMDKLLGKNNKSVEEWIYSTAKDKAVMNKQFIQLFNNPDSDVDIDEVADLLNVNVRPYVTGDSSKPAVNQTSALTKALARTKQKKTEDLKKEELGPSTEEQAASLEEQTLANKAKATIQRMFSGRAAIPGNETPTGAQYGAAQPPQEKRTYKYIRKYKTSSGSTVYVYPEDEVGGPAPPSLLNADKISITNNQSRYRV